MIILHKKKIIIFHLNKFICIIKRDTSITKDMIIFSSSFFATRNINLEMAQLEYPSNFFEAQKNKN